MNKNERIRKMNKELRDIYDKDGNRTGETWERRHGN